MKIRIRFRKFGVMKFIGHLDIMRYFQKAMRRAEIDICYSEGFSPHQIMSFAAPLGVGITSDGEYLDIEVNTTASSEASMRALNEVMVEGVEITSYIKLPDTAKAAMSVVAAADYKLYYKEGYQAPVSAAAFAEGITTFFLEPEEVTVTKKTKKSERVMDIKPLIYDFKALTKQEEPLQNAASDTPVFYIKLSTGSTDNLKPEFVLQTLFEKMGFEFVPEAIRIHRQDVYALGEDGCFCSLSSMGEEIL